MEVITKLKQGYHFSWTTQYLDLFALDYMSCKMLCNLLVLFLH